MLITPGQLQASIRDTRPLRIVKAADRRYVLGVAYSPGQIDGHGEFMTPETVENAAWTYLQDGGRQVGLFHQDGTGGHGQVVESYVYRGPTWTLTDASGSEQEIEPGTWLIGVIFDDPAWRIVRSGRVNGWSIDGVGKRRNVSRSDVEKARIAKAADPYARLKSALREGFSG